MMGGNHARLCPGGGKLSAFGSDGVVAFVMAFSLLFLFYDLAVKERVRPDLERRLHDLFVKTGIGLIVLMILEVALIAAVVFSPFVLIYVIGELGGKLAKPPKFAV
jgi:hypothetical protein